MYLLKVLTQRNLYLLDRTFYYVSNDEAKVGVRVEINFNKIIIVGYVLECKEVNKTKEELEDELGINLSFINTIIDEKTILSDNLLKLAFELKKRYIYPLIGVLQTMLPPSLKPKDTFKNAAKKKMVRYYSLNEEKLNSYKANKNEEKIISKFTGKKQILYKDLNQSKTLQNLIKNEIITLNEAEEYRYHLKSIFNNYEDKITLSDKQDKIFREILTSNDQTFLLHGVTGSGKTEIYIKLIEHYYKEGKGAIVLVPEISLTPLMISRLFAYFKEDIAVLHSSLTSAQIYDEYRKISEGKAKIVVGTRSAIFAPVNNLGIIVIDEENDECYKQDDQGLLYNAKEVALIRAKIENCKVILGSATPSIEDMAKAKNGQYHLLELEERYNNIALPRVYLIDSKNYKNYSALSSIFSLELIKQLKLTLLKNKQAILFINRRGYSNYMICRECGHVFKCPHCGLPLHYHREKKVLYCHHCEYQISVPRKCPKCDSHFLGYGDFGIEKVEEEFKKLFPGVKYLILDSDRASKTLQIESILDAFNKKEVQVLIGTQIVAKGHDFENVSLVGVLNADTLLNFPNYRSNEMTFSLLTQVIGRCGRKDEEGVAVIQSSAVTNESIISATKQNYMAFYDYELRNRKTLNNPPFSSILAIEISTKNSNKLDEYVMKIKNYFVSLGIEETEVIGPSIFHYSKYKCWRQIFIKYKKLINLIDHVESLLDIYKGDSNVKIELNFNPYSY